MTVTIQKTSKAIKKKIVIAKLVWWFGWLMFGLGAIKQPVHQNMVLIGASLGVVGGIMMLSAKIKRWWNHG